MDSERAQLKSMRVMARPPSPAPWIVAAILTALAFSVGRFTTSDMSGPQRPRRIAASSSAPQPKSMDLGVLEGCVDDLGTLQDRVDRECPALAAAMGAAPTLVAADVESEGADALSADGGVAAHVAATKAHEARRVAFRRAFVARVLGVTGSPGEWLADYVCLGDKLRNRTIREMEATMDDPSAYPDTVDEIIADARQEREAMLGDIRARIGPTQFRKLQMLGGLSILSLACPERPVTVTQPAEPSDAGVPQAP